jgi:excisionase family DNA binding protein
VSAFADEIKAAVREVVREEVRAALAEVRGEAGPARAPEKMLSVGEAAHYLGLAASSVYKMAARCELPSVKIGRRVLFGIADLDSYAQACRRSPERVKTLAAKAQERT